MANASFPNQIISIAAPRATSAKTEGNHAVMGLHARTARVSKDASQARYCAMANASPQKQTTCIAARLATVPAKIKAKPVAMAHRASWMRLQTHTNACRAACKDKYCATGNASPQAQVIYTAAPKAAVQAMTRMQRIIRARPVATAHPANKGNANRVVLPVRFSAMGSASPQARTIHIAVPKGIAPETTRMPTITTARLAAMAHPARAACANRDVLRGKSSATGSASHRDQVIYTVAPKATAQAMISKPTIIRARLAVMAHHANRAHASRDVLLVRFSVMDSASRRERAICIAAQKATAQVTI